MPVLGDQAERITFEFTGQTDDMLTQGWCSHAKYRT